MNAKPAILLTLGLLAAIVYMTIAIGVGFRLTPVIQALLWGAAAAASLGLVAALLKRPRLARVGWSFTVLVILGLTVQDEMRIAEMHANSGRNNRTENELLLANADARVPCDNGDVAMLQMSNNPGTDRYSLSIRIIPADRTGKSDLLVSTSGQYRPPSDEGVRHYRARTFTDCHNAAYPSLDAMMDRLRSHYATERHKYEKPV
jgi:hypothetical protein